MTDSQALVSGAPREALFRSEGGNCFRRADHKETRDIAAHLARLRALDE